MENKINMLLNSEKMQKAFEYAFNDDENTLAQQLALVQIPAFSHEEKARSEYFAKLMQDMGYETTTDEVYNVYTKIKGTGCGPTVYITAHLDTVFPMDTPLEIKKEGTKIYVPGIGDDTRGLAEILSILRCIKEAELIPVGDIIIGANVCEEGLGDLKRVKTFFRDHKDEIDGFITVDGSGTSICAGAVGSYRYKVTFEGPGGHSNGAFGLVNPIHALGRAIAYISELRTPVEPKTTFCVGVIEGGTSVNSIAYSASLLMDMRSICAQELDKIDEQFKECIQKAVEDENARWETERELADKGQGYRFDTSARITAKIEKIGDRPAGSQPDDAQIVAAVKGAFNAVGIDDIRIHSASTDANVPISLGIPSVAIGGGGTGGGAHSLGEWFDPTDAYKGVQRILLTLFTLAGLDGVSEPQLDVRKK